ncbi:protein of unknown function [Methylococcus capsulatus]|uniref:Uncharacterized protein n=1 Tax=Methylococcus capsulatus TaxID=414 RepID=A0AA35V624_METCP|nr:protein of unknown function [Methylococcus capsulatus]
MGSTGGMLMGAYDCIIQKDFFRVGLLRQFGEKAMGGVRISVCEARVAFSTVTSTEGPFRP